MRNIGLIVLLGIALSGCLNMDSLSLGKGEERDTSFYLVDAKYRFICLGNTKICKDMTKIVSARSMLRPVEKAYDTTITGPNYPVSMVRMLLNPKDESYKSMPVGKEGRYFKLPKNEKTNTVWETMLRIEEDLFGTSV